MATITKIKLQNGQIYDLPSGGGGGETYTLSISGHTITLTGSGGSTSSVTVPDNNTTYTLSISGHTLTLTPSSGSAQTVTLPDNNTTYTLSISGHSLTLTPSSGSAQTITLPIPTKTSDLTNDSNFVSDANYVHTDNNFTTTEKNKLSGIAAGAEVNVQANWNQTSSSADDYIKNKPTIPTLPTTTIPTISISATTGTLSSSQVRRYGNVVQLRLTVANSASIGSGGNIFVGTVNTTGLRPIENTTVGSYYGSHAIGATLSNSGAITVRNASPTAMTASDGINLSFTYIVAS